MPDVTSFVKAQSPLSLAMSGESKKSDSAKSTDAKDTKSFISIMLAQLMENQTSTKTTTKSHKEDLKGEETLIETKDIKASSDEAKSVDDHLLDDMLKIVSALKNGTQSTVFPTLKSSSRLEKVLNNEVALKEFGDVKSVSDLMALSKKYSLGLEKLTFSQQKIESLQKEFPNLTKSNFFDTMEKITEAPKQEVSKLDKTPSISPLDTKIAKNEKPAEPSSALKDLMSKEPTKTEIKADVKTIQPVETLEIGDEVSINEKQSTKVTTLQTEEKLSSKTTVPTETVAQKIVSPLVEEKKTEKKVKVETASVKVSEPTEEPEVKTPSVTTRVSEPKIENSTNTKGLTEAILQTIKVEKPLSAKTPEANEIATTLIAPTTEEITSENSESKQNSNELKVEIKTTPKQELNIKQPSTTPKESLNQFANDLREKIENYKPPVMKVELALNPKNLGEVDVTLLTRGNNLHVSISSNSNTMTLFTQNQAEFKNALINMGFTNLEMNFSDHQGREQQQNQSKNKSGNLEDLGEDAFNETLTTIELVVPQYV